jgi:hypothetical protein
MLVLIEHMIVIAELIKDVGIGSHSTPEPIQDVLQLEAITPDLVHTLVILVKSLRTTCITKVKLVLVKH